jgi:hypothetical protein
MSHRYLSVLLQIKGATSIWKTRNYNSFNDFLEKTGHGPVERFARYEELVDVLLKHDAHRIKKGDRVTKSTMEVVGYEAAAQILDIESAGERNRVLDALRATALSERRPLTYQAAVTCKYRLLKLKLQPTKSVSGASLIKLREENAALKADKVRLTQTIKTLQKRLRDNGISDDLPTSFKNASTPTVSAS